MPYQHVYGPVPSRRLGRSLGVNPIPFKTCNYSCVYCQLGRTSKMSHERKDWLDPEAIAGEVDRSMATQGEGIDFVTFVGEGEPALCKSLGWLIDRAKEAADVPVAVVTNGSLFYRDDVRDDMARADVVMPTVDAADQDIFQRINRPYGRLPVGDMIDGLVKFRDRYEGRLWAEVMLVAGVNDTEAALLDLRRALDRIRPDRVYVNAPIRPPAEPWVKPPDAEGLVRAHAILGETVFIDHAESGTFSTEGFADPAEAVQMIVRRHPMRRDQILETLGTMPGGSANGVLDRMVSDGQIQRVDYRGQTYFATGVGRFKASDDG